MSYQTDFLNDGSATADSTYDPYVPSKAFDNLTNTYWLSDETAFPHWIKYNLGAEVAKKARKLRLLPGQQQIKDFKLEGSNNDSVWTELLEGEATWNVVWNEWEFNNAVAYQYYKITITSNHTGGDNTYAGITEIELMEAIESATKFNRGFN